MVPRWQKLIPSKSGLYGVAEKKKKGADSVGDFRPISLIHSFAKLFTKVLACRLAPQMGRLVQPNQSAFLRGRLIHENFKAVQLTAKVLHQKKKPAALLKIGISKAFDTVNWRFLIDLLQHMGFSRRWQNWISLILSTASTKIIVNGSLGRRICHARGLRQCDPLSPVLQRKKEDEGCKGAPCCHTGVADAGRPNPLQ